jgi:hypothetical protein
VIDLPECAVCGMSSDNLTRCKKCGDSFCEECGDIKEKTCIFCLDDETVDLDDDSDDPEDSDWN